jgi:Domain of unknown function (DUF5666)
MRAKPFLVAALLAVIALPAMAQGPQGTPANVRGKIAKVSDHSLAVKEPGGKTVTVMLAPNTAVRTLARKKIGDIKAGDYVGVTSMPGKDNKLHAVEIHYLPPAAPQGQFPWDLRHGSIMTNAHVEGVAKAKSGSTLSVDYKNGTSQIMVDRKTVIVTSVPGEMSDLKRGKAVFLRALKHPDGSITANNVTVEKNGIKPPM